MRIVIDVETNSLKNPTKIWCVAYKDLDTGACGVFRNLTDDPREAEALKTLLMDASLVVGHNLLEFDLPVLHNLLGVDVSINNCCDTLILSRLIDYSREGGHSIERYGKEFGFEKLDIGKSVNGHNPFFDQWSKEMEDYCARDVEICSRIYSLYRHIHLSPDWSAAIALEQSFQLVVNQLHGNGFAFNTSRATSLLDKVKGELSDLDAKIVQAFPPRLRQMREITPKVTKFGTLNRTDFRWVEGGDLSEYNGGAFCRCSWVSFNPSSHKQIVDVLQEAGWSPTDKTKTHIDLEREVSRQKYLPEEKRTLDLADVSDRMVVLGKYGWKINETNLDTLPATAPAPARLLAKRILLESRRRTLTEWLSLVCFEIRLEKDGILGIIPKQSLTQSGWKDEELTNELTTEKTWIEKEKEDEENTSSTLTDLRSQSLIEWLRSKKISAGFVKENADYLWITTTGQAQFEDCCALIAMPISVGTKQKKLKYKVTSERIKGRYQGIGAWSGRMSHQEPNTANIPNEYDTSGKKKLLGKELRSLWQAPRNRLLVGVDAEGIQLRIFAHYVDDKELTQSLVDGRKDNKTDPHSLNQRVLGSICKSRAAAKRFLYALLLGGGVGKLSEILECTRDEAEDAVHKFHKRYPGFDHLKRERFPSDAKRGFFTGLDGRQVRIPGDTVGQRKHLCMSGYLQNGEAIIMKKATLKWHVLLKQDKAILVNFVHDEWQTEVPNNMNIAIRIAKMQADSLESVGREIGLKCPLAGSYYNEEAKDYTIGVNWSVTH